MRRGFALLAAVALAGLTGPPAGAAARTVTVSFTGRITLWDDVDRIGDPVNPATPEEL